MSITTYAEDARKKSKGKIKAAITERWNTRVIPRGLDKLGRTGAQAYLSSYGKGISPAKIKDLALCAENMGAPDMAAGFWESAYTLETGETAQITDAPTVSVQAPSTPKKEVPSLVGIPEDLQPGRIQTMQPTDAPERELYYVSSNEFLGQPKRDGHRNLLLTDGDMVIHQSRSTSIMEPLHPQFEAAVKTAASECGPFILDGERYYRSVTGSEHRTAAQCATANAAAGHPTQLPTPVYAVFDCLFAQGKCLRSLSKGDRMAAAAAPCALIASYLSATEDTPDRPKLEVLAPQVSSEEKKQLLERQKEQGREGVVWSRNNAPYSGGKSHRDSYRTKFLQEGVFKVTGITRSKAQGRSLASIEVAWPNGTPAGSVGTGFDEATGASIAETFETGKPLSIEVRHQGTTEKGMLWHARFLNTLTER